jgi:glycosyltransferase involved in cell wall biosynthesis
MRIQFITSYSQLYGANRSLLTVIDSFKNKGYDVRVLLPSKGSMSEELKSRSINFDIIPYYSAFLYLKPILKHLLVPFLAFSNLIFSPIIVSRIRRFKPVLIYSNTSSENIGIFVAKILKIKHITHVREFMDLDYNAQFIFGNRIKKKFLKLSDGLIFVSDAVAQYVMGIGDRRNNTAVIHNGFPLNRKSNDFNQKMITPEINFGIVGIFDAAKGHHIAVEYFNRILVLYPHAKLHLFGDKDCNYKKRIIKMVQELNLNSKVIFHGFEKDTNRIFNSIDILLMFSRAEGFGRVTVEAMLHGVPVVGLNNAGTAELIVDKETGCLFENYDTFKSAVMYLIDSPENFYRIRENAFIRAEKKFDEKSYCDKVEKFVIKVVSIE